MRKLIIAVDFDNTIFTDAYPHVGSLIDGAKYTLQWLKDEGHTIIINTCREGHSLAHAIHALKKHEIPFDLINENSKERIDFYGMDSRKIGCDLLIDDRAIQVKSKDEVVNWYEVNDMLEDYLGYKKTLICIVGESGSGKTYLANYLSANYGVDMIQSYTDRPKRHEDEIGHTFLSKDEFDDLDMRHMIAFTTWHQGNGQIARYCCLDSDVTDPVMTYVIDERGLVYLKKYWSHKFNIFAVRMFASESRRIDRVGEERVARDEDKFSLKAEEFDLFIDNDYSDNMIKRYDRVFELVYSDDSPFIQNKYVTQ